MRISSKSSVACLFTFGKPFKYVVIRIVVCVCVNIRELYFLLIRVLYAYTCIVCVLCFCRYSNAEHSQLTPFIVLLLQQQIQKQNIQEQEADLNRQFKY